MLTGHYGETSLPRQINLVSFYCDPRDTLHSHLSSNRILVVLLTATAYHRITCLPRCGKEPSHNTLFKRYNCLTAPRKALGIDKKVDILHHIRDLPTAAERTAAAEKIKAIEREAMRHQQPQPGLVDLMDYLQSRGLHRALCTRNFECVEALPLLFSSPLERNC